MIESRGTIKLIDFWVRFMKASENGGIFVLDEFDSSIHPELVIGILDLFNNLETNIKNAQLIFNTHNPLYLQNKISYYDNPSMNINEFFKELFKECGMLEELNKINI